ncbi:MAG: hypothetical protein RL518_2615, partial [Pseudomonadota bacterium]
MGVVSKNSVAKAALGFFTGLGGLTAPAITASLSTATIAAKASAQDDAPKVEPGAGEGKLLEFLVSLTETKNGAQPDSKVASRALKAIVEDLDSKKISDPTKPLAAAVFLDLLDPGSKAVVADHILRRLDAGEPGPQLTESLVNALRISLEGRGGAEKAASLLAKALSDNEDERSAFEYLLKLIPDNENGNGAALARYATVALAAVSAEIPTQGIDPQLKDSLHLLIGKRPGGGELSKEEIVSVWRAVETLAQKDLEGGDAFVRQVLKSFLALGDISSEKKAAVLAESPERFVRVVLPLIAGMANSHSRDQVVAALPESVRGTCERVVSFREDTNALLRSLKLAEPSIGFDSVVGWARRDWEVVGRRDGMSFVKVSGDERRFEPGEEPDVVDLLKGIDSPLIIESLLLNVSSVGEVVRTINELDPSHRARRSFVEFRTDSAAKELAVLAREYTTGSINDGELLLGLVALSLQNPGTGAAQIAEGVLEPRLKEHGMERLWGYVSGREEFGEKEFQSLVLDLPGIVPGGHPDPTRTEVLDLMFRTLPDMPHFIRSSMSNQVSKLDALHRDLFRELASEDPRAGADLFGDELRDPCEDILWGLIHRLQNHNQAERDSLIARLEPIVINVIRSGDQKTLENLFKSRFLGIVCTPNVVVSALERFKFSDEFFDELSKVFFPRLNPLFKDQAHKDNLIAKLEPIVIDAFRSGDQKTLENLFKSGIHLEVCTSNVIASALDRLRLSKDDQALQMRHASEVDLMLSRTSADTVLEQFVIDSIRSSDYQTLWNLVEWRMHPGACTPHVIASALDHFESLKGDLPAQRMFFPLLDQMLWCTPADKDLLSTIPRIEPKLFELVPRAQEYGSHGGGSVTALVHLSLNGQINGLDEKLRARICDAESDEGTLDLCLYGLSKLPTTQANFECVLSRAKLWMDEDRLNLVGSAASSLEAQSRAVSAETDLGDVKGRLLDLL